MDAEMLAGLLYVGAAVALVPALVLGSRSEARLRAVDVRRLGLLIGLGGVVAPVLLLVGLQRTGGLSGSLLLNLEAPFTVVFAVLVFGEHLGSRSIVGGLVIVSAAGVMGAAPGSVRIDPIGVVLIAAACAAWAVDNNLTAQLVARDPRQIVGAKVVVAGCVNLAIALARGAEVGSELRVAAALGLGAVAYGLSVLLDAYALRAVGAAREAALFATAPFAGALIAVVAFGASITAPVGIAMVAMLIGVTVLVADDHGHAHRHVEVVHDHRHRHDDGHHDHHSLPVDGAGRGWHAHEHRHRPLVHVHPHASDDHHRHTH